MGEIINSPKGVKSGVPEKPVGTWHLLDTFSGRSFVKKKSLIMILK